MMLSITNYSVQFSSVTQSCPTLCNPMDCSTPGLPVHHQLPEFTQTHVHWVSDAIQPSHPLSSPSPPAFNLPESGSFQMIQLFASGGQSIRVSASALEKCKSKPQWGTTSQQSEWPSSKSLQIINDGEGTWRRGPSRTVCGNVNQCSQLGNSGGSLKN